MANYNLYTTTPSIGPDADNSPTILGTEFIVNQECWVTQFRWLRPAGSDSAVRKAALYESSGTLVSPVVDLPMPDFSQWGAADITPIKLTVGKRYIVAVLHPAGRYPATGAYFITGPNGSDTVRGPVTVPGSSNSVAQGSYIYRSVMTMPTETFNGAAYYSDVTLTDINPNPIVPSTVTKVFGENGWDTIQATPKVFIDGEWIPPTVKQWNGDGWNIS